MKPDFAWLKDKRVITPAVVCGVVGFLAAMLIFGKPWHLPPAWGDIPTWIATIAATVAGTIAYRVYRIEARRDQISDEERRGAQASKIAAWYGYRTESVIDTSRVQAINVEKPIWGAYLRNASDLPVYDLTVRFYFPGTSESAGEGDIYTVNKGVLPPSSTPILVEYDVTARRIYSSDPKTDAFHRVEIEFTDTQGIRWHRDVKGRLKPK